ncbi:MAG: hypothetical protein QOH86_1695, partial [Sphingomonadales bacterium]|nr:hypothetical protein [Sphingomonadales bacterium]
DLGSRGDPIVALERLLELAQADLSPHIVAREMIALRCGTGEQMPVIGMFLGGAGLADTMLYCRHNLYPLMPTGVAHALALVLGLLGVILGAWVRFLPPRPNRLTVSVLKQGELHGQFAFLMVTTLQRLLFKGNMPGAGPRTGKMQLLVIDRDFRALVGCLIEAIRGKLGRRRLRGVHLGRGDEIQIEGERQSVILDGELFQAEFGCPIVLKPTAPVSFLKLAA